MSKADSFAEVLESLLEGGFLVPIRARTQADDAECSDSACPTQVLYSDERGAAYVSLIPVPAN
jgi:hypothetical protein